MIGILGGMGTQAGLDFCNKLAVINRGKSDQKYPLFILYNKSNIPKRPENIKKYTKIGFISRLKLKDSGWITENVPYSNINTYCIPNKQIIYDNYHSTNNELNKTLVCDLYNKIKAKNLFDKRSRSAFGWGNYP